jgi:hypothetical protein
MTGFGIDGSSNGGVSGGVNGDINEVHRLALRDVLSQLDPSALTRPELLMMADVLGKALASFGDPPTNLGDELIV